MLDRGFLFVSVFASIIKNKLHMNSFAKDGSRLPVSVEGKGKKNSVQA